MDRRGAVSHRAARVPPRSPRRHGDDGRSDRRDRCCLDAGRGPRTRGLHRSRGRASRRARARVQRRPAADRRPRARRHDDPRLRALRRRSRARACLRARRRSLRARACRDGDVPDLGLRHRHPATTTSRGTTNGSARLRHHRHRPKLAPSGAGSRSAMTSRRRPSAARLSIPAALTEVRELAASRDVYAEYAAIAITRVIDSIVDDASRGAWASWLAARFAARLAPGTWFAPPIGMIDARIHATILRGWSPIAAPKARRSSSRAAQAGRPARSRVIYRAAPSARGRASAGGDRSVLDRLVTIAHVTDSEDSRPPRSTALGEACQRAGTPPTPRSR